MSFAWKDKTRIPLIVRYYKEPTNLSLPMIVNSSLRILPIISSPEDARKHNLPLIDIESIKDKVEKSLSQYTDTGEIELAEWLTWASIQRIKARISSFKPHIILFIGHGSMQGEEYCLVIQSEEHKNADFATVVKATHLFISPDHTPGLLLLNACESARTFCNVDKFQNLSFSLAKDGLPMVIGMLHKVRQDETLVHFSRVFFSQFLATYSGEKAILAYRQSLIVARGDHAGVLPIIYIRNTDRRKIFEGNLNTGSLNQINTIYNQKLPYQLKIEKGAVKFDSPFYIKRKADAELQKQIRGWGTTIVIKGAGQMGKSSLLVRACKEAQNIKQKSCLIDFHSIDNSDMDDLKTLFKYLARRIIFELKLPIKLEDYWKEYLGAKHNLTQFIEDTIISKAESPVYFLFDHVDVVFKFSYRDDFFATIRVWHNRRADNKKWNFLNIVIAHSTDPHLWIRDINQSPFNIASSIRLDDFNFEQVSEMNKKYGLPLKRNPEIERLMALVGGHPYLVRIALYSLVVNNWNLEQLIDAAIKARGPFGSHLSEYIRLLQKNKDLKKALRQVLSRGACYDESSFQRLWAAGLVHAETRQSVQMRCQLYHDYFITHL